MRRARGSSQSEAPVGSPPLELPVACRGGRALAAQEALAAKDRTALSRLEGHRGFPAALRAGGHRLGFGIAARCSLPLGLAGLAALRLVLEILVVEEVLFSRCEYEICSAVYTFEDAVLKLRHITCAPLINLNIVVG